MQGDPMPWWRACLSVLAAFFGVQSERNQLQDFSSNRFLPFLLAGVVLLFGFMGVVFLLVKLALVYL